MSNMPQWNNVTADFTSANQLRAAAGEQLSNVGTIFGNIGKQISDSQQQAFNNQLAVEKLNIEKERAASEASLRNLQAQAVSAQLAETAKKQQMDQIMQEAYNTLYGQNDQRIKEVEASLVDIENMKKAANGTDISNYIYRNMKDEREVKGESKGNKEYHTVGSKEQELQKELAVLVPKRGAVSSTEVYALANQIAMQRGLGPISVPESVKTELTQTADLTAQQTKAAETARKIAKELDINNLLDETTKYISEHYKNAWTPIFGKNVNQETTELVSAVRELVNLGLLSNNKNDYNLVKTILQPIHGIQPGFALPNWFDENYNVKKNYEYLAEKVIPAIKKIKTSEDREHILNQIKAQIGTK